MIAGCGGQLSSGYHQRTEVPVVHLSLQSREGIWQSRDVDISYTIQSYKPHFSLAGSLNFKSSLLMSYPIVNSFIARIHFLNGQGKIISSSPVNIHLSLFEFAEEEYSFHIAGEIPNQVEAFTFSYSGTFSDYGEKFPDTIRIHYSPGY